MTAMTLTAMGRRFGSVALLGACLGAWWAFGAEPALPPVPESGQGLAMRGVPPPVPPLPASPVARFRNWLAMPAERREAELATRPEAQREFLRRRLAEYENLSPGERDERLNATDLYWHLQQLLRRAPSERAEVLAQSPEVLRPVLIERLALWDRLPASEQEALLGHERTVRYLARLRQVQMPPMPGTNVAPTRAASEMFESEVARLGHLPPVEFRRLHARWQEFFETPPPRAARALRAMSDGEREEMTAVLERFRKLSPDQRRVCVNSFTRLAALSPEERSAFLRSAERWESLSAEERETWRRLVTRLPIFPPLPVEAGGPPLPQVPSQRALLSGTGAP